MTRYLAVLGRQPEISLAELAAQFRDIQKIAPDLARFSSDVTPSIDRLGGSLKLARELETDVEDYLFNLPEGKITFGISDYSKKATTRTVTARAMKLKKSLSKAGRSVRVVQNKTPILSTATAHHNHLGLKPKSVEIIRVNNQNFISLGAQNITAYAKRDQARPARDAKVGMLPPKLAQILINLCGPLPEKATILDPFCGTGVLLQEAYLMGFTPYGTDKDPRMVKFAKRNLDWLTERHANVADEPKFKLAVADATTFTWEPGIGAVACETYLGAPLLNPPSDLKLKQEQQICLEIISSFLKNLAPQIVANTPVVLAIPAWLRENGEYAKLNLDVLAKLEYNRSNDSGFGDLLYHRTGQIVARNIITLRKK